MSAALNKRSMEEEARQTLKRYLLRQKCSMGLGTPISRLFSEIGGVELPQVSRSLPRQSPLLSND
jgi:plasmid stability protein